MFELIDKMKHAEIVKFIPVKNYDELQNYGLDIPSIILKISDNKGKSQTIYFGNNDKNHIYIKRDISNEIGIILSNVFQPQDLMINELIDIAPLSISIDNVQKVIVIDSKNKIEFIKDKKNEQENTFIFINKDTNKIINNEDFNSLYVNIMALSASGYDRDIKKNNLHLSITLLLKNNEEVKVGFSERDNESYHIIYSEKSIPFYIDKNKVELVEHWIKRIIK